MFNKKRMLNKAKNELTDFNYAMQMAKKEKNIVKRNEKLKKIFSNKLFETKIKNIFKPADYNSEFGETNNSLLLNGYFEDEILWFASLIDMLSKLLNQFIEKEKNYEINFLLGKYNEAKNVLDEIDRDYGSSIWSIEQRINISELDEGTDSQRLYTKSIKEKISDVWTDIQLTLYSWRAEKNISARLYNFYFSKFEDDYEYIWIKTNFYGKNQFKNLDHIVITDSTASIIDIYHSFIKLCYCLFNSEDSKDFVLLKKAIKNVKSINDTRIKNFSIFVLKNVKNIKIEREVIEIVDFYTKGEYRKVIDRIIDAIKNKKFYADYLELIVKSCIRGHYQLPNYNDMVIDNIMSNMKSVLEKGNNYFEAIENLRKIINVAQNQSWSIVINTFLLKETFSTKYNSVKWGYINTFLGNPFQGYYLDEFSRNIFYTELLKEYAYSPTVKLHSIVNANVRNISLLDELGLPADRLQKYKAKMLFDNKEYIEAKSIYSAMFKSNDLLSKNDGLYGKLDCLIELTEYREAIKLIAECAIDNSNSVLGVPIDRLLINIEKNINHNLWGDINLSITYYIYAKKFNERENLLSIACDKFLNKNGYDKPSQIEINKFSKNVITYFLKNICVISTLDGSYVYNSSEEVEIERILICQKLVQLDTDNKKLYEDEIKKITQQVVIKKNIRIIEESKIYVDTESIKNKLIITLNEKYKRFMEIKDNNDTIRDLISLLKNNNLQYKLFNDEKSEIFKSLYMDFKNHFTAAEYGLENCLSTGIRHGVLVSSLRKPFEKEKLITLKDTKTKRYLDNRHWKNQLKSLLTDEECEKILKALGVFSEKIDSLIEKLRKDWIQIRGERENTEGLFDFRDNEFDIDLLQKECEKTNSFEEFSEILFDHFWKTTNNGLNSIREKIRNDMHNHFYIIMDNLKKELLDVSKEKFTELFDAMEHTKTEFQYTLDRIATWFNRSSESQIGNYDIQLPIDIGVEIVNNINPNFKIVPKINIEMRVNLLGDTLRGMVDILYIVFENIIKHSGIKEDKLDVNIMCRNKNGVLSLEVKNKMEKINFENRNIVKLNSIRECIKSGEFIEGARNEGGSGFFKIAKILKYDLKCFNSIDFDFLESEVFYIKIGMNIGAINGESNNC